MKHDELTLKSVMVDSSTNCAVISNSPTGNLPRVLVHTAFGPVIGGRANNGSVIFLEIPYALPPGRFEDPIALPKDYRYENKEYIKETAYAAQPKNDGQAAGTPFEDKVGYGEPTENPLFLNIAVPPTFPAKKGFPVKVYVHGGFLQFGSPHSLSSQAQYIAAARSEIWINIGYRLSVFGFLASEKPALPGNYGFKDQWLALEWIKANVEAFGGDPQDIELTGLSAGAHSVHQLLHHASILPVGKVAPFQSAAMQSNAILTDPKTPSQLQPQFNALCQALKLDPEAPDTLSIIKDPLRTPWSVITHLIETDALGLFGTFRGASSTGWVTVDPGLMEWQRSGGLARGLKEHGVKSILIGDLTDEWYLYSIAHPINGPSDLLPNLERYFPKTVAEHMIDAFPQLPKDAGSKEATRLYGDIMSFGQVHLPVRLFAKDMASNGFPVLRYEIRWTPEQHRPFGYVTHGCDRVLWALRMPGLDSNQAKIAKAWLDRVSEQVKAMNESGEAPSYNKENILTLREDKSIVWASDKKWDDIMKLYEVLEQNLKKEKIGVARSSL